MKAAAHSSRSRVLMEANASRRSSGFCPMHGYCPFSARVIASALISSIVRSWRTCCACVADTAKQNENAQAAVRTIALRKAFVLRMKRAPFRIHGSTFHNWKRACRCYICTAQQDFTVVIFKVIGSQEVRWLPFIVRPPRDLKEKLQTQLDGPAATGTNHRIGRRYVRRGASAAEYSSGSRGWIVVGPTVLAAKGIGKIGMVKNVEKFRAELGAESFCIFPGRSHREVPVAEAGVAEDIASHRAESSQCRRQQDRIALGEAAESSQRCAIQTSGIAAIEAKGLRDACRIRLTRRVRDWSRARSEIRRTPEEVPAIIQRAGAADISPRVHHAPRLRTGEDYDGVELPTLQHLRKAVTARDCIGYGQRTAMPDIKIAARVLAFRVRAVGRQAQSRAKIPVRADIVKRM